MQEDILTQQVQIDGTLVIGSENELACIAPLRDMVRYIYDDDTGKSCHHKRKYQKTSRLSPSFLRSLRIVVPRKLDTSTREI